MKQALLAIPLLAACSGPPDMQVVRDHGGHIRAEVARTGGRKEGPVRFFDASGALRTTGSYVRDSRNGAWVTTDPAGDTLAIVTFRMGKKDGLQGYWSPSGQLLRLEQFHGGQPDGPLYRFFADGTPRQITWYRRGVPDGPYLEWYKVDSNSVAITAGRFHAGERTGRWTWFYGNGRPQRQGTYLQGEPAGEWRWWEANGSLASARHYPPPDR